MYRIFVIYDDIYDCCSEIYEVIDVNPNDFNSSLTFVNYLHELSKCNNFKCKRLEIQYIKE